MHGVIIFLNEILGISILFMLFCHRSNHLMIYSFFSYLIVPLFLQWFVRSLSLYALVKLMSRKLNSIQGFNFETLLLVCLALKHVLLHDNVSHLVRWSYLITKDNNRIYPSIRILSLFWFMPSFFPRPSFLSFYVWFHYVSRICCYWSLSLHFSWPIIDENESWNP